MVVNMDDQTDGEYRKLPTLNVEPGKEKEEIRRIIKAAESESIFSEAESSSVASPWKIREMPEEDEMSIGMSKKHIQIKETLIIEEDQQSQISNIQAAPRLQESIRTEKIVMNFSKFSSPSNQNLTKVYSNAHRFYNPQNPFKYAWERVVVPETREVFLT